jgi:hypothetical protein
LECGVTDGDPVGNLNNHTWYYAHDNNRNEPDFWINDHYMNTPNAANQLAPGVVRCANESTNPMAQQNSTPRSEVANPMYNRLAAVNWALAHAEDPQTNGDECTKFVSDALWAGGLPQDATWNNNGHYVSGNPIKGHLPTVFTGSKTANTAPMLLDYLEHHYSYQWIPLGPMNAGNNNVPQAEPGDIIAYSWNGPDLKTGQYTIDHLAFVVGAADKNPQYPMVSEWGQLSWDLPINGPKYNLDNPNVHIIERGWTYSELNHMYLQQEPHHQNMTAYLLHFNGGNFVPNY